VAETVIIEPSSGWEPIRFRLLWSFRELAYFLIWRDLKLRYKQTLLGASWAVIYPFVTTIVFTVIFGNWLGVGSGFKGPYALNAFVGMVAWSFFSQGLSKGSTSISTASTVITRVYFPRLLLPIGSVLSFTIDLVIGVLILLPVMAFYSYTPILNILALPLFFLLLVVTTLGVAFIFGALHAQYRDVQYVIPFLVQVWFFATPIVYPVDAVPDAILPLYSINPMVSVVGGFRWAFLGGPFPSGIEFGVSALAAVVLFVVGALYFRRVERTVVDVV
jgi:lipopolysaccharide transport system permease protein